MKILLITLLIVWSQRNAVAYPQYFPRRELLPEAQHGGHSGMTQNPPMHQYQQSASALFPFNLHGGGFNQVFSSGGSPLQFQSTFPFLSSNSVHANSAAIAHNSEILHEIRAHLEKLKNSTSQGTDKALECPVSAGSNAHRIGDYCYTIDTTLRSYSIASLACKEKGGYLAEPTPTVAGITALREQLYGSNSEFGTENTARNALAAASQNCFIGARRTAVGNNFFEYLNSGQIIDNTNTGLLSGAVVDATMFQALGLSDTVNMFHVFNGGAAVATDNPLPVATTACSICQYDLVEN